MQLSQTAQIGLQRMSIRGEWIKHTTLHRKVTLNPFEEFGVLAPANTAVRALRNSLCGLCHS
jgi:hypothetical protein